MLKKLVIGIMTTVAISSLPTVALAEVSNSSQLVANVLPQARGSDGPYYLTDNPGAVAIIQTGVQTVAGGISVGGNFAGGAQIWVVDQSSNVYKGAIVSGSVEALNDQISCPSGTYTVEIYNPTTSIQSYGPLTIYFN